jgi:transposase InsO family protein
MLAENGIESSMSEPGCPYDNSCVESFFATLKKEMTQLQDMSCNCGENMLQ